MTLSLWLEFPALQPVVDELAHEVGNPTFVPHLTLMGSLPEIDTDELTAVIRQLPVPAEVALTGLGTKHEESRFVCLLAEQHNLARAFAQLYEVFPAARDEHFSDWPHVSLLYGTQAARHRWPEPPEAAARYGDRLFGSYQPSAMSVWDTSGDVAEWRENRRWTLPLTT